MDYIEHLLSNIAIFSILSLSLGLINGLCGQFSLGHAGFWALGAYVSGAYSTLAPLHLPDWLNLIISVSLGFISAALSGLLVGIPCLRLKGDYLAIATLGFSEIIRIAIINLDVVGGPRGLTDIPMWTGLPSILFFAVLTFIVLRNVRYSSHGRAILSVREDEVAAENIGINIFAYKTFAFCLGAGFAGLAGSLFAHNQQFLHPNGFTFMWSVVILLMIIFGGLGSFSGAIVGSFILTLLPEVLRMIHEAVAQWRMVIYSLLLIFLMILRPKGIFGKSEFRLGPFKKVFPEY